MAPSRERRSAHDPGAVLRDLAVSIADGGECVSDIGVLADQGTLFALASQSTVHRVVKSIDADLLEAIRGARTGARRIAWEAGYRHTAFITDQEGAEIAVLELRHRRRARVGDEIRCGKDTGMRNLPFVAFEHNQAWLELSLVAQELLAWLRALCLEGELALAEPKRLRQRVLHVAGKLARSARRTVLRLPRSWPWAEALVAAFARLRSLPAAAAP